MLFTSSDEPCERYKSRLERLRTTISTSLRFHQSPAHDDITPIGWCT